MSTRYKFIFYILFVIALFAVGCDKKEKTKHQQEKIVVAQLQTPIQKLFYSGTLAPISTTPVVAQVGGSIKQMYFSYGENVSQGQLLFAIDSSELADNYRKTVNDYIQKKQDFVSNQLSFNGTRALYRAGIIPKTQFETEKSQFENAVLNYLQSKYQLETVMRTAHVDFKEIEKLSISDTKKVNELLQKHFKHVPVLSPASGIALYPAHSTSGDDSDGLKKITVGSTIKKDQLLLSIGNLNGLSASFKVSEIDIDRIKKNMPVIVVCQAFSQMIMKGYVDAVSSQTMQDANSGGLGMFMVAVKIPTLTTEAKEKIRVGMTAKFEIDLSSAKEIMLPVEAVFQQNGQSVVTLLDKNDRKKIVPVVTGNTTPTSVVIHSGVKAGDRVILHD